MTAKKVTIAVIGLVIAFALGAVAVSLIKSATNPAKDDGFLGQADGPVETTAVTRTSPILAWYQNGGSAALDAVYAAANTPGGCPTIPSVVDTANQLPDIPDAEANIHWRAVVTDLALIGVQCSGGAVSSAPAKLPVDWNALQDRLRILVG